MNIRWMVLALALLAGSPHAWPQVGLGPAEGPLDAVVLSPYDLNRVVAGDMAPDFRLQDENGKVHQLSQYRGSNVVLVMYRGHW